MHLICKRDAARRAGRSETPAHETGHESRDQPRSVRQPETDRNPGDVRRGANNPEVAGSNPENPRHQKWQVRGLFRLMEGAFLLPLVNVFVNEVGWNLAPSLPAACWLAPQAPAWCWSFWRPTRRASWWRRCIAAFRADRRDRLTGAMRAQLRRARRSLGAGTTQPSDCTSNLGSLAGRGACALGGQRLAVDAEFGCRCGAHFIRAAGCIRAGSGCASGVVESDLPRRPQSRVLRRAAA